MEDGGRVVNLTSPIKTASGTRQIPAGSYRVEKTNQPGILSIHTNSDAHSSHLGDVREKDLNGTEGREGMSMNENEQLKYLGTPVKAVDGSTVPAGNYFVKKSFETPGAFGLYTKDNQHVGDVRQEDLANLMAEGRTVKVNEVLKNSLTYLPEERVGREHYQERETVVYEKLLEKFGIKKKSGK
jgi:hypothetical protein